MQEVENQEDSLTSGLSEYVEGYSSLPINIREGINNQVCDYVDKLLCDIEQTESPVEQMFLIRANAMSDDPRWNVFNNGTPRECVIVTPQSSVDVQGHHYRVDFRVSYYSLETDKYGVVFVEIDGHNFHEKTKQQATHDKRRGRLLASECDALIRFTGTEVFERPTQCVEEAFNLAKEKFQGK